jgi:hypothetical protein
MYLYLSVEEICKVVLLELELLELEFFKYWF